MALTSIVRKTASRVVPLAVRALGAQRYNHHSSAALFATRSGLLSSKLHVFRSSLPSSLHHYSSKSDESLLRVLDTEIQCAQDSDDTDRVEEIPHGFPFKIEDNPGQQTITLTREYQGESITVEVHMPDLVTGENNEDDDDDDDDTESANQSQIPLVVRVAKKNGPCLEFGVTAYADEIAIDSLSIKDPSNTEDQIAYEGPDFGDLDENLQKAFHKYLEIRGVKPATTNFLHEYMINKDSKEYMVWLQNLKKFVAA